MPTVKITPKEAEVLLHRLTLDDCISEALTDVPEDEPPFLYSKDTVAATCRQMLIELETDGQLTLDDPLTLEILEDVVDGNTWGPGLEDAVYNGEMTSKQASEWRRVMRRLNAKLREAGIEAEFPMV